MSSIDTKLKNLCETIRQAYKYLTKNSVNNNNAHLTTCSNCDSKINTKELHKVNNVNCGGEAVSINHFGLCQFPPYGKITIDMRYNGCPVCHKDLRSETVVSKHKQFVEKINILLRDYLKSGGKENEIPYINQIIRGMNKKEG